jgi:ADP-heptose:LPS heptosyltransferase
MEKRGNSLLRLLDQYLGLLILGFLAIALKFKRLFGMHKSVESDSCLLVCFGAIGDLIVLTTAAKQQLAEKKVYLVCSGLNHPCALLYSDFYKGIERVDLKSLFSVYRSCKKFGVNQIIDSTQWANIGPIMVGIATLLSRSIISAGFQSKIKMRNAVYDETIIHSRHIHEVANFINLIAGEIKVLNNAQLSNSLPFLYGRRAKKNTRKVLLHMWPAGFRSHLKAWPESHWQILVKYLVAQDYAVYLSGSTGDERKTTDFIERSGLSLFNLAGVFDLSGLRHFLQEEIEFAISVNTGILHLLVDAGVPVIGLHGPTNPERWGPLGSSSIALLPQLGPSAYLHYGFEYPEADEDAYSLNQLTVAQVTEAIEKLQAHA